MFVIVDRRHVVVATFHHWSDCIQYVDSNKNHRYELVDEPAVDQLIDEYMKRMRVDDANPTGKP